MDLLMCGLLAVGLGAYSTYILATCVSEKILRTSSKHCRFSGIGSELIDEQSKVTDPPKEDQLRTEMCG
jgi:hypothetical protein